MATKITKPAPVPDEFKLLDRFWQASNYLSVGQVRIGETKI